MSDLQDLLFVSLFLLSISSTPLVAQPENSNPSSIGYFNFVYHKSSNERLVLTSDLPIVLTEGIYLYPEKPANNTHVVLAGTARLYRATLNTEESSIIRLESDNSFAEVAVNGHSLCPITRADTPDEDSIHIFVMAGELRWNGCGRVYYPQEASELIKLDDGSWKLVVKNLKGTTQKPSDINIISDYFIRAIFTNEQSLTSQVIELTCIFCMVVAMPALFYVAIRLSAPNPWYP